MAVALSMVAACGPADDGQWSTGSRSPSASASKRYIVAFNNPSGKHALRAVGKVVLDLPAHSAAAAVLPDAAVKALRNNPHIEFVELDPKRYMLAQSVPYGIPMVQADQLSDSAAGNRTVCIIDSGYNLGHEDLPGASNVTGTNDPGTGSWNVDGYGHGTHVAGTIAGLNNDRGVVGVLPNGTLKLHIVKVFGNDGDWAYSSSLVAALDICRANGAHVVSMSLGGSFKSKTEDRAFKAAYNAGVLAVAAAGNDGNTRHSYPASYNSVISVAAIDQDSVVASFSQQTNQVELAAPGVGVRSTVPMGAGTSTSFSVGGTGYVAAAMDGSPLGTVNGPLVDCGLGTATCAGATGAVCLIQRGSISFSDKVLACQAGGGAAAVIYNNEAGVLYGTLGETVTSIPSVGVSMADGATLLGQLGQSSALSIAADNYAAWDGTSMATPHVSGVAALIWSYNTSWTNAQIRSALTATALDLGPAGKDNAYGHGLVQAKAALDSLQVPPSCTPTETSETSCSDGLDNDCDTLFDNDDPDCGGSTCTLLPPGSTCTANSQCCSNRCKGKSGKKTCK